MNVYLGGPMRGIPQFNFPAFFTAAKKLRAYGYNVFNPAERDNYVYGTRIWKDNETGDLGAAAQVGFSLRDALAADMSWIASKADVVALLPGWEHSKGCLAEKALAEALGLDVWYLGLDFTQEGDGDDL